MDGWKIFFVFFWGGFRLFSGAVLLVLGSGKILILKVKLVGPEFHHQALRPSEVFPVLHPE